MKECYYIENEKRDYYGFSWYLPDATKDSPACKCIMAVALGRTLSMDGLNILQDDNTLTGIEYDAILAFDNKAGTVDDLKVIEGLAKKLKIELVRK